MSENIFVTQYFLRFNITSAQCIYVPRSRHLLRTTPGWTGLGTGAGLGMGLKVLHPVCVYVCMCVGKQSQPTEETLMTAAFNGCTVSQSPHAPNNQPTNNDKMVYSSNQ